MDIRQKLILLSGGVRWLLKDDFNDTVAAGSVNGTLATPTGGARTGVDTNSKISVGSGVLNFATGEATNDGVWYSQRTRIAGRALVCKVTPSNTSGAIVLGWDANQSGSVLEFLQFFSNAAIRISGNAGSNLPSVSAYTATPYTVMGILRTTGMLWLIKGGAFVNWSLLYPIAQGTGNPFPVLNVGNTVSIFTSDFMRIPQNLIYIVPLASDAFTRANGAPGVTGGGGSEESGGTGLTWTDQKGVSAIASNALTFSSLTTSLGIATVPCGTTNVMVEAVCTRAAGNSGLTLRWTDANNYIAAYLDGTNLVVVEVVAGTPNTLATTAVTYGATKRLIASTNATKLRFYYGDALVGSELTTAVTTGNAHGLYTSDTGATFDNLVVWAKGNGGEYNFLDRYTR